MLGNKVFKIFQRVFSIKNLEINFGAKSYFDMVDISNTVLSSPPILDSFSDDELLRLLDLSIPEYPCHSQGVERMIKELIRVSTKVCEHQSRHGMIISARTSRKEKSKLDTKRDFVML